MRSTKAPSDRGFLVPGISFGLGVDILKVIGNNKTYQKARTNHMTISNTTGGNFSRQRPTALSAIEVSEVAVNDRAQELHSIKSNGDWAVRPHHMGYTSQDWKKFTGVKKTDAQNAYWSRLKAQARFELGVDDAEVEAARASLEQNF